MQHIIRHLFRVDRLEEVPRQRLEDLVRDYPSFGVGHYLLSHKLQAEKADGFVGETHKTNLYFTNPYWLQWLLQRDEPVAKKAPAEEIFVENTFDTVSSGGDAFTEEPLTESSFTEEALSDHPLPSSPEPEPLSDETPVETSGEIIDQRIDQQAESQTQPAAIDITENNTPSAADQLLQSIAEIQGRRQETHETSPPSVALVATALEQAEEDIIHERILEASPAKTANSESEEKSSQPEDTEPSEESQALANAFLEAGVRDPEAREQEPEAPIHDEEPAFVLEEAVPETEASADEVYTPEITPETWEFEPARAVEVYTETATNAGGNAETAGQQAEQIEQVEQVEPAEQHTEEVQPAGQEPSATQETAPQETVPVAIFEPYHTVDYFASQGIRLSLDENPSDRLGKQMKSFTDWLKVMRKLPQKNREIIPDIAAEHQVQKIAAHSIEGKEVITETMADVLAKQGMREKAVDMYRKLSLLDPDKSAYFATKIEQLKVN